MMTKRRIPAAMQTSLVWGIAAPSLFTFWFLLSPVKFVLKFFLLWLVFAFHWSERKLALAKLLCCSFFLLLFWINGNLVQFCPIGKADVGQSYYLHLLQMLPVLNPALLLLDSARRPSISADSMLVINDLIIFANWFVFVVIRLQSSRDNVDSLNG